MKINLSYIIYLLTFFISDNCFTQQIAGITAYVSGINQPIDVKHCGDDRLFIADRAGRIRIIDPDGTLRPTPFLNITSKISSTGSEEGFLGFAFSPDYKTDGKFYVNYTANISGQLTSVIEEYKVSAADSNLANVSSALTILTQAQPFSNHNGGNMMFGKDSCLYINLGDGGSGGDPYGNGQNKNTFLGKILRIDIRNSSASQPYIVPPANPFYNDATPGVKKEIWAYGVRNPWRSSFDRITGDLWTGEVGQGSREEVDFQPANFPGGANYGWNIMEGTACYNPSPGCSGAGLVLPLYEYTHSAGQSITGGYVYRSAQSKTLFGMYIFADYVQRWIDGLRQNSGTLDGPVTRLITSAQSTGNPVSFGEDRFGDLYILFFGNNTVYKISDTTSTRRPKAYFTAIAQNGGSSYLLQGLQGRNLTYQWLRNGTAIPSATSPDYTVNSSGTYNLKVTNILNISDTSEPFVFGALPVSLVNFTAQRVANNVQLQWQTAMEQITRGFVIQRKTNEQADFTDIAIIPTSAPNGNSASIINYSYTDITPPADQKLFYRLRVKNKDGTFFNSDVRVVSKTGKGFTVYPNPAHDKAVIYLDEYSKPVQLIIYDGLGKRIRTHQLTRQLNTITVNGLKGVYTLQLIDDSGYTMQRRKLVIL